MNSLSAMFRLNSCTASTPSSVIWRFVFFSSEPFFFLAGSWWDRPFDVFQNNFCHDIRLWKQRLLQLFPHGRPGPVRLCGRSPHCRTASQAGFSSFFVPLPAECGVPERTDMSYLTGDSIRDGQVCALHCAAGAYCERQGLMGGGTAPSGPGGQSEKYSRAPLSAIICRMAGSALL